jgi:hypothetical protein
MLPLPTAHGHGYKPSFWPRRVRVAILLGPALMGTILSIATGKAGWSVLVASTSCGHCARHRLLSVHHPVAAAVAVLVLVLGEFVILYVLGSTSMRLVRLCASVLSIRRRPPQGTPAKAGRRSRSAHERKAGDSHPGGGSCAQPRRRRRRWRVRPAGRFRLRGTEGIGLDRKVQVTASAGATLHYLCIIHPWMQGSIKVT